MRGFLFAETCALAACSSGARVQPDGNAPTAAQSTPDEDRAEEEEQPAQGSNGECNAGGLHSCAWL